MPSTSNFFSAPASKSGSSKSSNFFTQPAAPTTAGHQPTSPILKALSILDLPRSVIVNGAVEGRKFAEGKDASVSEFAKNVKAHKGVGDHIHTGNVWADRAIGLGGDVALDPLTYVSGGASVGAHGTELTYEGAARRLLSKEAVDVLGEDAAKEAAGRVLHARSPNVLQSHEFDAIGAKAGVKFGGKIVPGTEGALRAASTAKATVKAAAIEKVPGLDALGRRFASLPVLREAAKTDPVGAFQVKEALRQTPVIAKTEGKAMASALEEIAAKHEGVDWSAVQHAMEGGTAADAATQAAATDMSAWFEASRKRAEELTGRTIPTRENYLPWVMTDEAKAGATKDATRKSFRNGGKQSFELRAELLGDKAEWMGHKLTGSPAERRQQVEKIAQEKFGTKLLKDDPLELAAGYANGMQRYIKNYGQVKALEDAGLAVPQRMIEVVDKKAGNLKKTVIRDLEDSVDQGAGFDQQTIADEIARNTPDTTAAKALRAEGSDAMVQARQAELVAGKAGAQVDTLTQAAEQMSTQAVAPVAADTTALQSNLDKAIAKLTKAEGQATATVPADTAALADKAKALHNELVGLPDDAALRREETALKVEHRQLTAEAAAPTKAEGMVTLFEPKGKPPVEVSVSEAMGILKESAAAANAAKAAGDAVAQAGHEDAIKALAPKIAEAMNATKEAGLGASGEGRIDEIVGRLQEIDHTRDRRNAILHEAGKLKQELGDATPTVDPKVRAKVEAARAEVVKHQAAFDAADVAKQGISPAEQQSIAEELAATQRKLAAAKGVQAEKLTEQADHLERATSLFAQADQLSKAGEENLSVIANLHAQFELAEVHQAEGVKDAVALRKYFDTIRTTKHIGADMAQDGLKQLAEGKWAEPWVVDAVDEVQGFLTRNKDTKGWLKTVDWITSRWKAYNLLTPGFHMRNYMGGLFNNELAGVDRGRYPEFFRAWRIVRGEGIDKLPEGPTREAFQHMLDHEVLDGGQFVHELDAGTSSGGGLLRKVGVPDKLDPTSLNNGLIHTSQKAGNAVENQLRGVLFLDRYVKTGSWQDALDAVAKYHFDYSDLSQFEKDVMKRAVPFYTWSRKNFPLQLEMAAKKPGSYTAFLHAKRNIELGVPEDGTVPNYYGSLLAIRSPFKSNGGDRLYFTPDTPFRDLAETFDTGKLIGSLNPLAKVPLEVNSNKQFYTGIPFNNKPAKLQSFPMVFAAHLLQPFQGKFGLPKVYSGDGGLYMSDKDQYKVESMLPLLGKLRRAAPQEKKYQDRALTSWLSMVAGLGSRTLTQSEMDGELLRRAAKTTSDNKLAKALGTDGTTG